MYLMLGITGGLNLAAGRVGQILTLSCLVFVHRTCAQSSLRSSLRSHLLGGVLAESDMATLDARRSPHIEAICWSTIRHSIDIELDLAAVLILSRLYHEISLPCERYI